MENSAEELDLSWTDQYLRTTEGGITYEPDIMDKINMKIVYSNIHNEIFHIVDETLKLQVNTKNSFVHEDTLLKTIHKHRDFDKKRYKCDSIVTYFISTNPQTIFENIHNESFTFDEESCFTTYDIPKTIVFQPSLFIFHQINTVYIMFREMILMNSSETPVSIIKKHKNKVTKRVRISNELPSYSTQRKTRKNLSD